MLSERFFGQPRMILTLHCYKNSLFEVYFSFCDWSPFNKIKRTIVNNLLAFCPDHEANYEQNDYYKIISIYCLK